MSIVQQWRSGARPRFVALAAGAGVTLALAACSDTATAPSRGLRAPESPRAASVPQTGGIVVHRTIDAVKKNKGKSELAHVAKDYTLSRREAKVTTGAPMAGLSESMSLESAPLPDLTFPASRRAGREGHWTRQTPVPGGGGDIVEAEGNGPGPASEIRLLRNGKVWATISSKWKRGATAWELERQERTLADGRLHDVLVVDRPAGHEALLNAAIGLRAFPGADPVALDECGSDPAVDPCQDQVDQLKSAAETLAAANLAAFAACAIPEPLEPWACAVALTTAYFASQAKTRAQQALARCRAANGGGADDNFDFSVGVRPRGIRTNACGSGGGGGDPEYCVYEVWYDVETGEILSEELLYCVYAT